MGERGVPISSTIREALKPDLDLTSQAIFDLLDYSKEHSSPIDNPDPEGAGEVVTLLQELEEQVLYEEITPAEAAKQFRTEATAKVKNAGLLHTDKTKGKRSSPVFMFRRRTRCT